MTHFKEGNYIKSFPGYDDTLDHQPSFNAWTFQCREVIFNQRIIKS